MTDETTNPIPESLHDPINREDVNETTKGLLVRAEHVAKSISDLTVHEAIVVFHAVTDMLSTIETREKSIVKTKFEEAMMWLQRHTVSETGAQMKANEEANAAATATVVPASDVPTPVTDAVPAAPEGAVVSNVAPSAN